MVRRVAPVTLTSLLTLRTTEKKKPKEFPWGEESIKIIATIDYLITAEESLPEICLLRLSQIHTLPGSPFLESDSSHLSQISNHQLGLGIRRFVPFLTTYLLMGRPC
jgi:hypothetical protein